jgi:hypothetical protein
MTTIKKRMDEVSNTGPVVSSKVRKAYKGCRWGWHHSYINA